MSRVLVVCTDGLVPAPQAVHDGRDRDDRARPQRQHRLHGALLERARVDLGPGGVVRGGSFVALRSRNQRLINAVLVAAAGGTASTDFLVAAAWPGPAAPGPGRALQTQILRLRGILGPAAGWLKTVGVTGYRLAGDPGGVDRSASRMR